MISVELIVSQRTLSDTQKENWYGHTWKIVLTHVHTHTHTPTPPIWNFGTSVIQLFHTIFFHEYISYIIPFFHSCFPFISRFITLSSWWSVLIPFFVHSKKEITLKMLFLMSASPQNLSMVQWLFVDRDLMIIVSTASSWWLTYRIRLINIY